MKKTCYLLLLVLAVKLNAQQQSIHIDYKVALADDGSFTKNRMFADEFWNAAKEADRLVFGLLINSEGSKFYQINTGITNTYAMDAAKMYASYLGVIYNVKENVLKQNEFLSSNIYVKEKKVDNWLLTNESKKIDNYVCYKATNTRTIVNSKGTFKFPVTAWYCPQLPYNFGPLGYGNLPGLILELQVRHVNYLAKKIDLSSKLDFNLYFLEKATVLTEDELNKKVDEFNNFDMK